MKILGLNAYHADAAAAVVCDGEVIAAVEEERFRRTKHWAGLPVSATGWCLKQTEFSLNDIDVVAVNRDGWAHLEKKIRYIVCHQPDPGLLWDRFKNMRQLESITHQIGSALNQEFTGEEVKVEHHQAHLASSFLVSPFDEAAVLSVDGFGDFTSTTWGVGRGDDIQVDGRVHFPHSLGVFYLTLTQYLGFPRYGDEYKVMGLAPYGEPSFVDEMYEIVQSQEDGTFKLNLDYFRHQDTDLDYQWTGGAPTVGEHYTDDLTELLGPARMPDEELNQRHRDMARSTQVRFESAVSDLLELVWKRTGLQNIVLSGGAAMNSVMNGKVVPKTPFEAVYIPPAPGDAGGAIGAALWAWQKRVNGSSRPETMIRSCLGPSFGEEECRRAVEARSEEIHARGVSSQRIECKDMLISQVLEVILGGGVVGWFQGRMEFGPRALGYRSILCDPRRDDMREIINNKIKLRESFRPFAPTILRERMGEWFTVNDDVPFMMKVYPIKKDKREEVPAVCHTDGTGRPQTLTEHQNPLYYRLIQRFYESTGVPMLLNTSFNENEPIVCRPEEAVDCFLRTEMDLLALESWVLQK